MLDQPPPVIRCTCCCPEDTHTGPNGHCMKPECRDEPCTPITALPSVPADINLRDRIIFAIGEHTVRECGRCSPDEDIADAVLAILPAPADRGAVLREAADALAAYVDRYRSPSITNWSGAVAFLRRMADEAQQAEPEAGCSHCGGAHSWDDCDAYSSLVAAEAQQSGTHAGEDCPRECYCCINPAGEA